MTFFPREAPAIFPYAIFLRLLFLCASGKYWYPLFPLRTRSTKMAASSTSKLVKEVVTVNGLPTVVSKILPQNNIHEHVIVVIPGNPGLVEFYDVFIATLFDALQGQSPVFAISHAGKWNLGACVKYLG